MPSTAPINGPAQQLQGAGTPGSGSNATRRDSETRYESLPIDFHSRVRAGFLEIAKREPKRCVVIDATGDVDTIAKAITDAVKERLGA